MSSNSVIINKMIMHMLDIEHNQIFYSDDFVELNETNLDYYHAKLDKTLYTPFSKYITVGSMHELLLRAKNMIDNENEFKRHAKEITQQLFDICKKIEDMPNSNLVFAECYKEGVQYVVIMKLNYRTIPMSIVQDGQVRISTGQVLPSLTARVDEAIIINVQTNELSLIEKKYTIDGRLNYYLNEQYIKGEVQLTDKEKYNTMKKVINKVDKIYAVNKGDSMPLLKQEIQEKLDVKAPIKPLEIVKKVLEKDYNASEESEILLNDMGIGEEDVIEQISIPKIDECKLVLDEDIVLSLPINEYLNGTHVRKTQTEAGTYNIEINNINEIIVK